MFERILDWIQWFRSRVSERAAREKEEERETKGKMNEPGRGVFI